MEDLEISEALSDGDDVDAGHAALLILKTTNGAGPTDCPGPLTRETALS
jgi:hypothetical protein